MITARTSRPLPTEAEQAAFIAAHRAESKKLAAEIEDARRNSLDRRFVVGFCAMTLGNDAEGSRIIRDDKSLSTENQAATLAAAGLSDGIR